MEDTKKLLDALKNGFVNTYENESRDWMNNIDENAIEQSLRDPEFDAFVRLIIEDGLSGGQKRPAA